jgi:N-acylneuraminate cytidylyltransferase
MKRHNWVAVVPARAGSKGLPGKNIRPLGGKPLYMHAVDEALKAGASKVIISTDIEDIIRADLPQAVIVCQRPEHLAGDNVSMSEVLLSLKKMISDDIFILLQPTSPLRKCQHILSALNIYYENDYELVMSVTEVDSSVLKYGLVSGESCFNPINNPNYCFSNRQSLPKVVKPNGAIYVTNTDSFYKNKGFPVSKIGYYAMPSIDSLDIDVLQDFEKVKSLFSGECL